MAVEMMALRIVHLVGGVFWVGAVFFIAYFLQPTMRQAGPAAAGPIMMGLHQRKLFTIVPLVALISILAGFRMMQIVSGGFFTDYFWSSAGRWYAGSSVPVLIGFFVGVFIGRPAMLKGLKLAAEDREKHKDEIAALQLRSALAMRLTASMLALGVVGMAIARYL